MKTDNECALTDADDDGRRVNLLENSVKEQSEMLTVNTDETERKRDRRKEREREKIRQEGGSVETKAEGLLFDSTEEGGREEAQRSTHRRH